MALAINTEMPSNAAVRRVADAITPPDTYTVAFNNTAGTFMALGVLATEDSAGTGVSFTSAKYNNVTMTALGTGQAWGTNNDLVQWFYLLNPAVGSNNIDIAWSYDVAQSRRRLMAGVITFTGNHPTVPVGSEFKATGSGAAASISGITSVNGSIVIAVAGHGFGNTAADMNGTGTLSFALAGSPDTAGDNIGGGYWASDGTAHQIDIDFSASDSFGIVAVEVKAATTAPNLLRVVQAELLRPFNMGSGRR